MDETCPDSRIMKYKPGERFGEWLILGRSTKLQTNGKRNFRWCMCLGCKRPYRVRIGNLATGSTSACQSCSNSGSGPLHCVYDGMHPYNVADGMFSEFVRYWDYMIQRCGFRCQMYAGILALEPLVDKQGVQPFSCYLFVFGGNACRL